MKKLNYFLFLSTILVLSGCSSVKKTDSPSVDIKKELTTKNRSTISLLSQIRQMPGINMQNGVPVINKTANSLNSSDNPEPLYVLNDYIVGNSFRSINQLIENFNVKNIEVITGSDASFYGSRGAKGVIKITTNN